MSNTREEVLNALSQPLDVQRVSKRSGAGSKSLSYLESQDVIATLNRIFGFDGWSDRVLAIEPVNENVWRATVEISARIGGEWITHSDTGIGLTRSQKAEEVEKCLKESVSDALKRAARKFGDQFGNCLYEKDAPEHAGLQRPAVASVEELERYANARKRAVERGFRTPSGNDPKLLENGVSVKECSDRTAALEKWLATPATPAPTTNRAADVAREVKAETVADVLDAEVESDDVDPFEDA